MTTCRGAVLMKGILRREVTIAATARKLLATHLVGRTVIGVLIEGSERLEPAITWRAVIHLGGLTRIVFCIRNVSRGDVDGRCRIRGFLNSRGKMRRLQKKYGDVEVKDAPYRLTGSRVVISADAG